MNIPVQRPRRRELLVSFMVDTAEQYEDRSWRTVGLRFVKRLDIPLNDDEDEAAVVDRLATRIQEAR